MLGRLYRAPHNKVLGESGLAFSTALRWSSLSSENSAARERKSDSDAGSWLLRLLSRESNMQERKLASNDGGVK